jgi:hypothetical protein
MRNRGVTADVRGDDRVHVPCYINAIGPFADTAPQNLGELHG